MIRPAMRADRGHVIRLLKDSRAGAGFDSPDGPTGFVFPFDPVYAERLFLSHFSPRRLCLVNDIDGTPQGILMAAAFEHPFGPVWLANETVWWIDPAHRGSAAVRMLDAYETWAGAEGCAFAGMAGMGADPIVAKLYERRGYRVAETHFLKAL
jgi:GNAT superfamily N-acetyltransferase